MSGYTHETCETKIYRQPDLTNRCLCHLSNDEVRQKYLNPALVFIRGKGDTRVVHFVQQRYEVPVSEYRSNFSWPVKKQPRMSYVSSNSKVQLKEKYERQKDTMVGYSDSGNSKYWSKGIAEKIFEK